MKFVGVIDDNVIVFNLYVGVKFDDNGKLICNLRKLRNFKNCYDIEYKFYV